MSDNIEILYIEAEELKKEVYDLKKELRAKIRLIALTDLAIKKLEGENKRNE